MARQRNIASVWKSKPTTEGAGVHLKRVFGFHEVPDLDPFLLLDDFHSEDPAEYLAGFPWHPHRGIETITYMHQGTVEHGDSMGNRGTIASGDVQWMTAGSGIIHQEMPKGDGRKRMWGFQLWANLPAKQKMMEPRYRDIRKGTIPEVEMDSGAMAKIICGTVDRVSGPVQDIVTEPEYLDVTVPAGTTFRHRIGNGHTVFAYVIDGTVYLDDASKVRRRREVGVEHLVLFDRDGEEIVIAAEEKPVRFLLISGKPLNEPVAWYGPIVMNTRHELRKAFEEYEQGTFIKTQRSQRKNKI